MKNNKIKMEWYIDVESDDFWFNLSDKNLKDEIYKHATYSKRTKKQAMKIAQKLANKHQTIFYIWSFKRNQKAKSTKNGMMKVHYFYPKED